MIINVALACNNNYAYYCAETIVSLLLNTKKDIFYNFYIIIDNVCEEYKNRLVKLKNIKDCNIIFLELDKNENSIIKESINSRLKLASLLPDVDKIIYSDCDVTYLDDLSELWLENFDDYYTGNMIEAGFNLERNIEYLGYLTKEDKERYKLNIHKFYFNSGFMVMNLKKIREDGVENELINFIIKYKDKSTTLDQDAINMVLYDKIKPISFKWSFIISYFKMRKKRIKDKDVLKDLKYSLKNPKAIHFAANKKPDKIYVSLFHIFSYHKINKYKKLFWEYVGYTDWKNEKTYEVIYKFPLNIFKKIFK